MFTVDVKQQHNNSNNYHLPVIDSSSICPNFWGVSFIPILLYRNNTVKFLSTRTDRPVQMHKQSKAQIMQSYQGLQYLPFHLHISVAFNCPSKPNCYILGSIMVIILTLKGPILTAADDIHKYFFIVFQRK